MKKTISTTLIVCFLMAGLSAQTFQEIEGKTVTEELQITDGATNGYILRSDASGNAIWANPAALPITPDWNDLLNIPAGFADGTDDGAADTDWTIGSGSIYNSTDNVGVGHNAPSELLHVKDGNLYLEDGELIFDPIGTVPTKIYQAGANLRVDAFANLQLRTGEPYSISFSDASGEYARFRGGDVEGLGIGTSSPENKLTIVDDDESVAVANTVEIDKTYSTTTGTLKAMEVTLTRENAGAIQGLDLNVYGNGDGSGIVNGFDMTVNTLNTAAQTEGLDIHVTRSGGTGTSPTLGFRVQASNTSANSSVYGVLSEVCGAGSGVKYGVYSSPQGVCTNGGTYYSGYFNGDVFTTGSYLPSDATLKKNFSTQTSVLDKLRKLDVVNYEYDANKYHFMNLPKGRQTGFTAQNLAIQFPTLVQEIIHPAAMPDMVEQGLEAPRDETHFQGVNYTGLVPYIVKGVQELADKNENQDDEIDLLKKENEMLKAQLAELKQMIKNIEK